ncbi:MAG: transposase [Patescibacteria group bacterium]
MRINARKTIRLPNYDYSSPDDYFVTICTKDRECLLGNVIDDEMVLNKYGKIIEQYWFDLPNHYPNIILDEFVVMPNHVHMIISIVGAGSPRPSTVLPRPSMNQNAIRNIKPIHQINDNCVRGEETSPLRKIRKITLGNIVAYFKYQTTKQINKILCNIGHKIWQRNYFERIIRNERELNKTREYIQNNPYNWPNDRNNNL